ncbi:MAG TPA: RNA polymerase sigma factor [Thermoanaerobaculia bacterium]|jgi:RNA polymerase sigma-70 factor (ECF subfamily)|nr:RNA polymerase sigma factor [Thermoanaerobaculia bacterium]
MDVNGSHSCLGLIETPRPAALVGGLSIDSTLVQRAREGDASAREELARVSGDAAFRFALQLLGDRELARDVAQDSVLRLFSSLRRVDPERPLQPWLFSIVRNRVIDLRRRALSRGERGAALPSRAAAGDAGELPHDPPDAGPGPFERSERGELQRLMWSCLGRLERAHREILVLRDYQDLSYREIAEVLAVPLGTVMSRLHAARRKLRAEVLATGYRFGGGS